MANFVGHLLSVDDVGLKVYSQKNEGDTIEAVEHKINQASTLGYWVIFRKQGNEYTPVKFLDSKRNKHYTLS
ncbi:hypothetical protein [Legionella impletisoli]|uniref:Uncharacterized protein n=1 Tax=Legionella impletisoli TaxID=343510 RepID=A0A917NAV0_9GAMM|nr:hypothetical protein [Legionella impletisoli]GGI82657.1 hypothetical protein GCM10007966_09100 [Legionella impletisoli]